MVNETTVPEVDLGRRKALQWSIAAAGVASSGLAAAQNRGANRTSDNASRPSMPTWELQAKGASGLRRVVRPRPVPTDNEVLIRVRAVALNAQDRMVLDGVIDPGYPRIPASDGAGEVVAVGQAVTRLKVGDRVASHFMQHYQGGEVTPFKMSALTGVNVDGMLAEHVCLPEWAAVPFPAHLDFAEGASLPIAALTAYHALVVSGVRAGDSVLLLGTGGVSLFGLQFAKAMGLRTLITSSSDEKLEQARKLGADVLINRRNRRDWDAVVLAETDGQGVDCVFDVVGARNYLQSANALKLGGFLAAIGVLGVDGQQIPDITFALLGKRLRLQAMNVGSRDLYERMNAMVALHGIRPVIDRRFEFAAAPEAYAYYADGDNFGKVVIQS